MPDPTYWFVKNLPKKVRAYVGTLHGFVCATNFPEAPVKWYFRREGSNKTSEIKDTGKCSFEEDLTPEARKILSLRDAVDLGDSGVYECRIVANKNEKRTPEMATKCHLKVVPVSGTPHTRVYYGHASLYLSLPNSLHSHLSWMNYAKKIITNN